MGELIDNERPTFPEMGLVECNRTQNLLLGICVCVSKFLNMK